MTKSSKIKAAAYAVLLIGVLWCAIGFYRNFGSSSSPAPSAADPAATNQGSSTNVATTTATTPAAASVNQRRRGRMMRYGAGLLIFVLGLGGVLAYDISHYIGHRFEKFIFDDEGEGWRDPEYEQAEKLWANGQHLEAIQLMRDHLQEHPREQYVALRIAEIYENDLGNYVAAALEYEEILKKPLPPERWGWAAIHLANIYSGKLNKVAEAEALLRRITKDHPDTAAAKKARERLGEPEPAPPTPAQPDAPAAGKEPERPPHHLPPGFRPKT